MKKLLLSISLCLFSSISSGWCVEGDCVNGEGFFQYDNFVSYEGSFKRSRFHGQGTYTKVRGDKYVGEWDNNKMHGHGTYYWENGDKYVGQFWNLRRHGYGVLTRLA
jgi:hypothetical protein